MLAAAFLHEPSLVFLDEPFINLDPIYQRKLREFLQEYIEAGGTVFMASHLLDIAEKLCDRVAVIQDGAIVATGSVDEIRGPGSSRCGFGRPSSECTSATRSSTSPSSWHRRPSDSSCPSPSRTFGS